MTDAAIDNDITITVTRSAGADGAIVIFIDTTFEPNASDGSPGLRVCVGEGVVFDGKPREYVPEANDRTASALYFGADIADLTYQP